MRITPAMVEQAEHRLATGTSPDVLTDRVILEEAWCHTHPALVPHHVDQWVDV